MTELSPATQSVLDAFICCPVETSDQLALAAVLEALADQVVPANGSRKNNDIRAELLAIAAKLEDAND